MRKIIVSVVLAAGLVAAAWAQNAPAPVTPEQELQNALKDVSSTQLGTLTGADVQQLMMRVALAAQKVRYVQRVRIASFELPGVGQFMTGNPGTGALFAVGDLAIFAGALIGGYYLLPTNVQFNNLDYLNAPLQTIHDRWTSNSVLEYLPTAAVLAGGMAARFLLGVFSARDAGQDARRNIADGKVTFQPTFGLWDDGMGMGMGRGMGMGMGMRFRY